MLGLYWDNGKEAGNSACWAFGFYVVGKESQVNFLRACGEFFVVYRNNGSVATMRKACHVLGVLHPGIISSPLISTQDPQDADGDWVAVKLKLSYHNGYI